MEENYTKDPFDDTIFGRYLTGTATPDEERRLMEWIGESEENRRSFAGIRALWQRTRLDAAPDNARFIRSLNKLNNKIDAIERNSTPGGRNRKLYTVRRAAAVAAMIALLAAGFVSYKFISAAGKFVCNNPDSMAMNIILPDGTNVWLGAQTTLTYDRSFMKRGRNVELDGQAYFDVTHDPGQPFVVKTSLFNIRVLGTVFNVKAYRDDTLAETTLAEGSISLQNHKSQNLIILHPGQQAVYDAGEDALTVHETTVGNLLLVRYGVITIPDATLEDIMLRIEETFGVTLRPLGGELPGGRYNFSMQKDAPVEDAVELLQFASGCRFEIIYDE